MARVKGRTRIKSVKTHNQGDTTSTFSPPISPWPAYRSKLGSIALPCFRIILSILAFLITMLVGALLVRAAAMLRTNRYASDQTLINHAALIYAAHTSLPLLTAHILPTLVFPRMFLIKAEAAQSTVQQLRLGTFPCRTIKKQSAKLSPRLDQYEHSVNQLYLFTFLKLRAGLPGRARGFLEYGELSVKKLNDAISTTRDRSHRQEVLISAEELFDFFRGWGCCRDRGINTHGLRVLDEYNVHLDTRLRETLPVLEQLLTMLVNVWDRYADVFETLNSIGLSHCRGSFEQSLSEGEQWLWDGAYNEEEMGEEQSSGWITSATRKWRNWNRPPRTPVSISFCRHAHLANADRGQILSTADAISIGVFHYWSIYTILSALRRHNILLYRSANSYLPPGDFWHWQLAINFTSTIFDRPPFRYPTGAIQRDPLRLSKQENDTMAALDRLIRNRTLLRDSPDKWIWSHPSTANVTLRPFPDQIPCPPRLELQAGLPAWFLCNSSLSSPEIPLYPFADPNSTTYKRLLGLQTMRDVFALILDLQEPFDSAIAQHMEFMDAREKEVGRRIKENATRRARRRAQSRKKPGQG
ncbi:MAG: hypothetical protein L6R38_008131 [Xanthoria sp. 2 TBL-2021]|nr:MAG: hypothetical protein L6R38_008131 [Xanthoria sp. 2 TBL-2021]